MTRSRAILTGSVVVGLGVVGCRGASPARDVVPVDAATPNAPPSAIVHATVIDPGTGGIERRDLTIVIVGNRIAAVGPSATLQPPAGAVVHDAAGGFVIPGLWDVHVHLSQVGAAAFPFLVANGITSVRDMGSDFGQIQQWRRDRTTGAAIPRILAAGPKLDGGSWVERLYFAWRTKEQRIVTSPADARRAVDDLKAQGVDFIKVHNRLSPAVYDAIVTQARRDGLPFAGHLPESGPLAAASAGQRTIEHGRGMLMCAADTWVAIHDDPKASSGAQYCAPVDQQAALLPTLVRAGTWFTPTLVSWRGNGKVGDPALASWLLTLPGDSIAWPALRSHWTAMGGSPPSPFERQLMGQFGALASAASHAGVPLLAGTDLGDPYVIPGFALHDELSLMVAAGVSPLAALQSATSEPARAFGLERVLGGIAVGQAADLVLLDGDPLADINNTRRIHAVVLNGRWLAH